MITRRAVLNGLLGCGVTLALPDLTLASVGSEKRLVVIVLRGAMDALDVVQPYGDPAFRGLRGASALLPGQGLVDLDGRFGLHAGLADLHPLFVSGELGVVHAVSTPHRSRSHFEGQDILENGSAGTGARDGWLNRLLAHMPRSRSVAIDIAQQRSLVLKGEVRVEHWLPNLDLALPPARSARMRAMYEGDPLFSDALERAVMAESVDVDVAPGQRKSGVLATAELAAAALSGDARVAVFSIGGWDTHISQNRLLQPPLRELSTAILNLRAKLGPVWAETVVAAVSEFGRTVRLNGGGGTDHGTGGAILLAGGAISGGAGGRVLATRWPGLGEGDLYEDRDLMPTDDVRRYLGWLIRDLFGISRETIERAVFPQVDLGSNMRLLGP